VNDRIAELEAARLSCEADEDAALRLQEKLARLRATVAQTRCGSSLLQGKHFVRDWLGSSLGASLWVRCASLPCCSSQRHGPISTT